MTTEAAKRARRRNASGGRPRKDGQRHGCGKLVQPSSEERAHSAVQSMVDARKRVYGIPDALARSKDGGSVVGRLLASGALANGMAQREDMADAAHEFLIRRTAYLSAVQAPRSTRSGSDIGYIPEQVGGDDVDAPVRLIETDEQYADRCNSARRKYAEIRRAILECGDREAMSALEMAVVEEREPQSDTMIGALRCGLNAIHRVLRYERKRVA